MNFTPFIIGWVCMGIATLGLAAYRKFLSTYEDDNLHIEDRGITAKQFASARKFEAIDRWGEGLTILLAATGVILGGIYLYSAWLRS